MRPKILILNGPNLNLLGRREPQVYGNVSFEEVFSKWQVAFPDVELLYFQSNWEGGLIDRIQKAKEEGIKAIIINAGGYTHTSVAIADALKAVAIQPTIEVHLSHILAREPYRHQSLLATATQGIISGLGLKGYELAITYVQGLLKV